jgi:FPC/CPF motif-containing protein YcgG/pyrroloquinoline quinone (PQQ) biosynthesis protein C
MSAELGTLERRARPWRERFVFGSTLGAVDPPAWLGEIYQQFARTVETDGYPCYFGQQALRVGDLYVSCVDGEERALLPQTLRRFIEVVRSKPRHRSNLALFVAPTGSDPSHAEYQRYCWDTLSYLRQHDEYDWGNTPIDEPDSASWEFPFGGAQFFVVGLSPSYQRRRSRNVCATMVLLFQPRESFEDATGPSIGPRARREVRDRLARWDAIGVHPDLGVYGDPTNREWKQYFLSDDMRPMSGVCPLAKVTTSDTQERNGETAMKNEQASKQLQDRQAVIEHLSERVDDFIVQSPFFAQWRSGDVSQADAERFLLAFDHLVASFPPLIAIGVSRMSEAGRVALATNLYQECGEGDVKRTHHAIYRKFLDSIGLDWRSTTATTFTEQWRRELWNHTFRSEPGASVGAIAAGEFLAQPALSRIYDVLKPMFPHADVEYFTSHLELETEHVNEIAELIATECEGPESHRHMMEGFEHGLACWHNWFVSMADFVFSARSVA